MNYFDYLGLASETQAKDLIKAALTRFLDEGYRSALGDAGEMVLEMILERNGMVILKGPFTNPGQHNADIIAFNRSDGKVYFFDNKVQTTKLTASAAPNLSTIEGKRKNIELAYRLLGDIQDNDLKNEIRKALWAARKNPLSANWIISNASVAEINNFTTRISTRMVRAGVRFADVFENDIVYKGVAGSIEGVRGSGKFLREFGQKSLKVLPYAGIGASIYFNTPRVQAAMEEDQIYRDMMTYLGYEPYSPHGSTERILSVIAAEEAFSEGGAWGGGALGLLGGPWLALGTGFVGGMVGDYAGGAYGGWQYDRINYISPEELDYILTPIGEYGLEGQYLPFSPLTND